MKTVKSPFIWIISLCWILVSCGTQLPDENRNEPAALESGLLTEDALPEEPAQQREELSGYPEPLQLGYPEPESSSGYPKPEKMQVEPAGNGVKLDVGKLRPNIVAQYPHNSDVFTQGLIWHDGAFYESGGLRGQSALYRVGLEDGVATQKVSIDDSFFGEGIAVVADRIIMLTWQAGVALVFDKASFEEIGRFNYDGEGWGLCYDETGNQLWMSNGSSVIVSRDPDTFEVTREVPVTEAGSSVTQLNELECVGDRIYANIWKSDRLVGIDMQTGDVIASIDASSLLTEAEWAALNPGSQVLNGIAYNKESETFYLTGKQWPKLFEVTFVPDIVEN